MKLKSASRLPSSQFARNLSPTSVGPRSDPLRSELWQREQLRSKVAFPRPACVVVYTPSQTLTSESPSCACNNDALITAVSAADARQIGSVLCTSERPPRPGLAEWAGRVSHAT